MRFEAVAKKAQPLPPRLCPALFPYGAACRLGAVSCRNPRPGGTSGRTWRLQGPREREKCLLVGSLSSLTERGSFLCRFGARHRRQKLVQVPTKHFKNIP